MKTIYSVIVVLLLLCQAQLSMCPAAMAPMLCAHTTSLPDVQSDSSSANTSPANQLAAHLAGCEMLSNALSLSAPNALEPSGQLPLIIAPSPSNPSPRLIDPPPRWSFI